VSKATRRSRLLVIVGAALASLVIAAPAQGASDPISVITPDPPPSPLPPVPPPTGRLYGPCGIAVDSTGRFYVSDYYHHAVDVFGGPSTVQLANVDPLGGPCGLALDSANRLFVNNYHRNVTRFNASPSFGAGTVFPLPTDQTALHLPTGVAINTLTNRLYVNHRSYIGVYDLDGVPIEEGGEPLRIGEGSLGDGYGVAVSMFGATLGRIYVPDAATNTVKVFNSAGAVDDPIAELKDPFGKPFTSLRDSAIAIDKETGEVYFADNLQPSNTEKPQASIYVYSPTNTYKGRLKYNVIDALPVGLAVDNSLAATQGNVYVTSGNTSPASIYVYGKGAATLATPLPPIGSGLQPPGSVSGTGSSGSGASAVSSSQDEAAKAPASSPSATTSTTVTQEDNVRVAVDGKLSPKKLPREGEAPISVSVGWKIESADGSPPPKLKGLRIEINRHGRFDTTGLPVCPIAKIQPATTQRALSNCRSALVGRGSFSAQIALKGQEGDRKSTRLNSSHIL